MTIDIRNAIVRIRGGTAGQYIDVKIGEGNVTYDERRNMNYVRNRGRLDTVREGDDEPMDVRLDANWEYITGSGGSNTLPSIEDALKKRGAASTWTSSSSDPCEPYAVDLVILHVPPCGEDTPETIILPDFRYESIAHDLRGATFAISGKCNAKEAIPTRGAVSSY